MSEEEAKDFVELILSPTTEAEVEAIEDDTSEHNDASQCLQHLLLHRIEAWREVRMEGHDRRERVQITVQEACGHFVRPNAIDLDELDNELIRHGIRITPIKGVMSLVVANAGHAGAKAIFANTTWRSYPETLKREGADGISTPAISFGGRAHRHRATVFPLTQIVDESELPKLKSPTKVEKTAWLPVQHHDASIGIKSYLRAKAQSRSGRVSLRISRMTSTFAMPARWAIDVIWSCIS